MPEFRGLAALEPDENTATAAGGQLGEGPLSAFCRAACAPLVHETPLARPVLLRLDDNALG